MWKIAFAVLAMGLPALLTGCVSPGGTSGCEWTRAIYTNDGDVLTDATAEQILIHNEAGARVCGW